MGKSVDQLPKVKPRLQIKGDDGLKVAPSPQSPLKDKGFQQAKTHKTMAKKAPAANTHKEPSRADKMARERAKNVDKH